jgi:hypothetical protein
MDRTKKSRTWPGVYAVGKLCDRHNAVIGRAPLEGFLHQTNTLDTLGRDRPESACRFE